KAVDTFSFNVEEGEILGFLGPNGAGKTTTLKLLSGIIYPTEGDAAVMGYVPWKREKEFKRNIAVVMAQKTQLWWDLPANESILLNRYIYDLSEAEYRKNLDRLTDLFNVGDLLPVQVRRLSLGERMKFEIIASLVHNPKVIFLDEPTIGLDVAAQRDMRNFIREYNRKYRTAVYRNSPGPVVLGYTYNQMILYTLLAVFTSNLVSVSMASGIAAEIKNGGYSKYLILPVNHFRYKLAEFMGDKFFNMILIFAGMFFLCLFFVLNGFFELSILKTASYLVVLLAAMLLQFMINYCIAGLAFWMSEIGGVFTIVGVINAIISGGVFPFDIFGPAALAISKLLPFYYTTYFAVNILIGRIGGADVSGGLLVMFVWVLLLSLLIKLVWGKGARKYIAAGG
ncbi:MAG: ATP-binding cassette domain-containing protein, partial [Treponema sp.]|nr:ATP-binding cassette domain-containing protein [Treponema sp.]